MKTIKSGLLALIALGYLAANAQQEEKMTVVEVGDKAPDFNVASGGVDFSLSEQLKTGPVVLVFYRSGDW